MAFLTTAQKTVLVVLPSVSGTLSVFGSLFIIVEVAKSQKKRGKVYHRLLLGMSICDFLVSIGFIFSKWPMPSDADILDDFAMAGNLATCCAQGFLIQLSTAVVLYNLSLAMYYLLMVQYNWKESRLQKLEPYMHASAVIVGLSTAFTGLFLDLYNPAKLWCWIASFPEGCNGEGCKRGQYALIYRWAIFYGPIWGAIVAVAAIMCTMYLTVRQQETRNNTYAPEGIECNRKYSRKVAFQGMLYVGAFFITFVPATISRLVESISATHETSFFLLLMFAVTLPLQGFLNFFVYFYPRMKAKSNNRESSKLAALLVWFTSIFVGEDQFTAEASEDVMSVPKPCHEAE